MSWDRRLWGVELRSPGSPTMLIGTAWDRSERVTPFSEPSRALLFKNRFLARRWCRGEHAFYEGRTDVCATWRFVPVPVRETVKKEVR